MLATQEEGSGVVTIQTQRKEREEGRRFQILSAIMPDRAKKQTELTLCVLQVCAA